MRFDGLTSFRSPFVALLVTIRKTPLPVHYGRHRKASKFVTSANFEDRTQMLRNVAKKGLDTPNQAALLLLSQNFVGYDKDVSQQL